LSYETLTVDTSAPFDRGTYTVKIVPYFVGYEADIPGTLAAGVYEEFDIVIADACGQLSPLVWADPTVPDTLAYQLGTGAQKRDTFSFTNPDTGCPITICPWKIDYGDGNGFVAPLSIHETLLTVT